jgi:hypothetical protein
MRQLSRNKLFLVAVVLLVFLPSCQFVSVHWATLTRVDAPLSFKADKRLGMQEPDAEELVRLPVTVRWKSEDFALTDGRQFGVFINTSIPSPGDIARVRLCSRLAELPPAPGDYRGICTDQRDLVRFTTKHSVSIDCFEPHFNRGKRRMNDHQVTVVLLDKDKRRIGEAAAEVPFRVDAKDARKCRGFDS